MAYLHDRGIVHRDLKPGNIFCDEGVVKVGDYGLSKFISCSRRSGHTESIGTVHYMAPEVANGRYGKEIDVYALGVILYELLTGRVPFEGESIGEVLMKHLTAKPDVSMLPEPYRGVVARALEKDPALRFRSAAEMLAALPAPSGGVETFSVKPRPVVADDWRDQRSRLSWPLNPSAEEPILAHRVRGERWQQVSPMPRKAAPHAGQPHAATHLRADRPGRFSARATSGSDDRVLAICLHAHRAVRRISAGVDVGAGHQRQVVCGCARACPPRQPRCRRRIAGSTAWMAAAWRAKRPPRPWSSSRRANGWPS